MVVTLFGFVEKFMYLLKYHQIGRTRIRSFLRIIGMLEPSAIVNNQPVEYFYTQFRSSRGMLRVICESLMCSCVNFQGRIHDCCR